jgi:hypothetical protein
MAMARAQSEDSANSQFFIMFSPNLRLDGKYSPIGRVISGMAYVDAIERGEPPAHPSRILQASLAADGVPPPPAPPAPIASAVPPLPTGTMGGDKGAAAGIPAARPKAANAAQLPAKAPGRKR